MHGERSYPTKHDVGKTAGEVPLRSRAEGGMWILERTPGDPRQTVHLNGPESPEKPRGRRMKCVAMSRLIRDSNHGKDSPNAVAPT